MQCTTTSWLPFSRCEIALVRPNGGAYVVTVTQRGLAMKRQRKGKQNLLSVQLPSRLVDSIIPDLLSSLDESWPGFATQYLKDELLSKFVGKDTDPPDVRRDRGIAKFLEAERLNERTNFRLQYASIVDKDFVWIQYGSLIRRIRRLIRTILGPLNEEEIFRSFSHTNGASTRVRRSPIAALHKLRGDAHITESALQHWELAVNVDNGVHINASQTVEFVQGSELFTVPKKSDIDRVACKEPEINMLLQRACGRHIRGRLRRFGIDLNDQGHNQRLAADAVRLGLATIDLSSASDTITSILVQQLLPTDWWSLLDDLRVKSTYIKSHNKVHHLEMFSSMGNGFTFELESLIFFAITRVVAGSSGHSTKFISVYGDDIIAPTAVVPRLMRILRFFGFIPNEKKTHYKGSFRESCGKHYMQGFDVSPFYIRRPVATLPDLIRLLNRVMEWDARGWGFMMTPSLIAFHWKYSQHVPRRFWGGVDPEDVTALVTGHAPRYRLTAVAKSMKRDDEAALVHWMMSTSGRKGLEEDAEYDVSQVACHGDNSEVDPSRIVGYKASRCSRGWHTSWNPWLLNQGPATCSKSNHSLKRDSEFVKL